MKRLHLPSIQIGGVVVALTLVSGCVTTGATAQEGKVSDGYTAALNAVNSVYGEFSAGYRRDLRQSSLDTYMNQMRFQVIGLPGSKNALTEIALPGPQGLLCDGQDHSWWLRGAMAPLTEISAKTAKIEAAPKATGFRLAWAAARADLDQELKGGPDYTKLAETAKAKCEDDFTKAVAQLNGGRGVKESVSLATLVTAFEIFKKFYSAADALAGQIGSVVYRNKQAAAFKKFVTDEKTSTAFENSITSLKSYWGQRSLGKRVVAAQSFVVSYVTLESNHKAVVAAKLKTKSPPDADKIVKEVDSALKSGLTALLDAADTYDTAYDIGALEEIKALENAFKKMVEAAKKDDFSFDKMSALFEDVKAIYEQVQKTIEAAKEARDGIKAALASDGTPPKAGGK